jgi:hypothetical protein
VCSGLRGNGVGDYEKNKREREECDWHKKKKTLWFILLLENIWEI